MSNNKQSSVEWLVEQIKKDINLRLRGFDIHKAFEQAKAMHKEEVERAWRNGDGIFDLTSDIFAEKYYNKMFTNPNDEN